MELKEMFEAQRKLDEHILKEHKEVKNIFNKKIVAFFVELAEASNEIRFFKYWSNKKPSPKEVILEELIDAVHFALSIGNILDREIIYNHNYVPKMELGDFADDYIRITSNMISVKVSYEKETEELLEYLYIELIENLLGFICKLGFTEKDIEYMYYKKNSINHKRQEEGY
jgi:dimeric dUTPase (all-alpha-NTP-PPase superfamily)